MYDQIFVYVYETYEDKHIDKQYMTFYIQYCITVHQTDNFIQSCRVLIRLDDILAAESHLNS